MGGVVTQAGRLAALLEPLGLRDLGDCVDAGHTITLIGPDEPRFWTVFAASPEYRDGAPDPMDRWSLRVLGPVASALGGVPLFPFGGPPHHPFHSWALATGRFWESPIKFLVHDEAGLFASFRGAIRWNKPIEIARTVQPCPTCDAPCKTACPVGAFIDGYNVAICKSHVSSPAGTDCRTNGCLARRACPVGAGHRLPTQSAFHMEAFL